jgi:sugar lactone lactonase YvrE
VDQSFITGATGPRGVAIDGAHVYWTHAAGGGSIGRADLDGGGADQAFITTAASPQGIALDSLGIYWTHTVSGAGKVGRASVDGTGQNPSFVPTGNATPCGVIVDGDKLYWANGGSPGSIGRAHGAFSVDQSFITATQDPCGVVEAGGYLYWANRGSNTIGRANLDGTGVAPSFIATSSPPCGVAVDGAHVYWTTAAGTVGRADLDGGNVDGSFITGAQGPCGVTVTPTLEASPAAVGFPETPVGGRSAIVALVITNTSSSVLDVYDLGLLGPNAADFEVTGDGCTPNVTPPVSGCVVNLRFAPSGAGARAATLRLTGNASGPPLDLALAGTGVADAVQPPGSPVAPLPPVNPTVPRFLSASVRPAVFRVSPLGAAEVPVSAVARGTTFRYSLSAPARVVFTIYRRLPGRRVGRACVPRTRANHLRGGCTRLGRAGRFARQSAAGRNAKPFSGRIGRRHLAPASYRARLVAGAGGSTSTPRLLSFRVVR